jgi:hypothetical protein
MLRRATNKPVMMRERSTICKSQEIKKGIKYGMLRFDAAFEACRSTLFILRIRCLNYTRPGLPGPVCTKSENAIKLNSFLVLIPMNHRQQKFLQSFALSHRQTI